MNMIPVDINELKKGYKRSSNQKILSQFAESKHDCVKIEDYSQSDCHSCAASLNSSIKRFHMTGLRVIVRGGEVYLLKKSKIE